VYRHVRGEQEPERVLYMAVSSDKYEEVLSDRLGQFIVNRMQVRLVIFDPQEERIIQWIE
jgi:hypothetical protein